VYTYQVMNENIKFIEETIQRKREIYSNIQTVFVNQAKYKLNKDLNIARDAWLNDKVKRVIALKKQKPANLRKWFYLLADDEMLEHIDEKIRDYISIRDVIIRAIYCMYALDPYENEPNGGDRLIAELQYAQTLINRYRTNLIDREKEPSFEEGWIDQLLIILDSGIEYMKVLRHLFYRDLNYLGFSDWGYTYGPEWVSKQKVQYITPIGLEKILGIRSGATRNIINDKDLLEESEEYKKNLPDYLLKKDSVITEWSSKIRFKEEKTKVISIIKTREYLEDLGYRLRFISEAGSYPKYTYRENNQSFTSPDCETLKNLCNPSDENNKPWTEIKKEMSKYIEDKIVPNRKKLMVVDFCDNNSDILGGLFNLHKSRVHTCRNNNKDEHIYKYFETVYEFLDKSSKSFDGILIKEIEKLSKEITEKNGNKNFSKAIWTKQINEIFNGYFDKEGQIAEQRKYTDKNPIIKVIETNSNNINKISSDLFELHESIEKIKKYLDKTEVLISIIDLKNTDYREELNKSICFFKLLKSVNYNIRCIGLFINAHKINKDFSQELKNSNDYLMSGFDNSIYLGKDCGINDYCTYIMAISDILYCSIHEADDKYGSDVHNTLSNINDLESGPITISAIFPTDKMTNEKIIRNLYEQSDQQQFIFYEDIKRGLGGNDRGSQSYLYGIKKEEELIEQPGNIIFSEISEENTSLNQLIMIKTFNLRKEEEEG